MSKSDSNMQKRVYQKDFKSIKPRRLVPGITGRTIWYSERTGCNSESLALQRYRDGLEINNESVANDDIRQQVFDQALTLIERTGITKKGRLENAVAITTKGEIIKADCKAVQKSDALSILSQSITINNLNEKSAMLLFPVDEQRAMELDLDEFVIADVSNRMDPELNFTFSYLPDKGLLAGLINKPGIYQPFALPKSPLLKAAFFTLCHNWRLVVNDLQIRQKLDISNKKIPAISDRICQLILCAPDYFDAGLEHYQNHRDLPGGPGSLTPPTGIGGQNLCEKCFGGFLGEIDIIDEHVVMPPIIKYCWHKRPRCSKWKSIGPYPDDKFYGIGRVTQIAIHPKNGATVIAGAAGGGVWKTTNSGRSWKPLMELEPTLTIGAVAIADSNPKIMYAASGEDGGGYNPAWSGVGLYRSTNSGKNWTLMTSVPSTRFSAIVVHPTQPNTIYLAGNVGLHKSTDGGQTWISNPGLSSLFDKQITDVVLAHDDPDRLYIGVNGDGVYRSTTGGEDTGMIAAFEKLNDANQLPSGSSAGWTKLAIGRNGANGSDFVVAKLGGSGSRIFSSTDAGDSWSELASNVASIGFDEWCSVIAVDPDDQDIMYAGAAKTLKRTTNGGANAGDWTSILADVHADQQDFAIDLKDPSRVYLANDGGVYLTSDRGDNWKFRSGNLRITQFYDIDISNNDRDIVGGGAQDNGVYYRNALGQWKHIPWGDGTQVAIDPTDPEIFYFSSQNGLPNWLRRSIDGGASHQGLGTAGLSGGSPWVTIIKLDPTTPIADPANNRKLFVCGSNNLFRSVDGGQNWQRVEDDEGNPFNPGTISALEYAPSNASILYLATTAGAVYKGINGGASAADWTRLDVAGSSGDALFPNTRIPAIRVHPTNPDHVWLVFGGAGVSHTGRPNMILNPLGISHLFKSLDGGVNWTDASGQFPALSLPDVPTSAVALHDTLPNVAYAGTDVGVFRTVDGGVSWTAFQEGLARSPVTELRFNRTSDRLFAATMGRGVYIRDV